MEKMTLRHTNRTMRFVNENHDVCTNCGKAFSTGATTHLGYSSTRKLMYVSSCCSDLLKETIIRHIYSPRRYTAPPDNAVLWRFMDFTKFVSLLKDRALFFTRADKFEDPFEGAKGLLKNKPKWDKFYTQFFIEATRTVPGGANLNRTDKELLKDAKRLLGQINHSGQTANTRTFVNCWYEDKFESEAMWKLYTSSLNHGIAIKTTMKKLYTALGRNPNIGIGRINYFDYSKNFAGINDAFWFKRKSFEHEKEVRAVIYDHKAEEVSGKLTAVNLNVLIDKIYISPTAEPWFKELVLDILAKYGINKKIQTSDLNAKPFH